MIVLGNQWPAWIQFWVMLSALAAGFKWPTFVDAISRNPVPPTRAFAYLFLWPGMDARAFLGNNQRVTAPTMQEWMTCAGQIAFGMVLLALGVWLVRVSPFLAGWLGIAAIVFLLFLGGFGLSSAFWRWCGVNARLLIHAPFQTSSLQEFWGQRWNRGFHDVVMEYVFLPLTSRSSIATATAVAFAVSCLVHELIVSVPARAIWGPPSLYFAIQAAAIGWERSPLGRKLGFGRGAIGIVFCYAVAFGLLPVMYHPTFIRRVMVPMLVAIAEAF